MKTRNEKRGTRNYGKKSADISADFLRAIRESPLPYSRGCSVGAYHDAPVFYFIAFIISSARALQNSARHVGEFNFCAADSLEAKPVSTKNEG